MDLKTVSTKYIVQELIRREAVITMYVPSTGNSQIGIAKDKNKKRSPENKENFLFYDVKGPAFILRILETETIDWGKEVMEALE